MISLQGQLSSTPVPTIKICSPSSLYLHYDFHIYPSIPAHFLVEKNNQLLQEPG